MHLTETIYVQQTGNPKLTGKLRLYNRELQQMSKRLQEITALNDHSEFISGVCFFKDQLQYQSATMDTLALQLKENERNLVQNIVRNPVAISRRTAAYYSGQWELLLRFERQLSELRDEFNWFCNNWE